MSVVVSVMGVNTGPLFNVEEQLCEYVESLLEINSENIFVNSNFVEIATPMDTPRIQVPEEPLSPTTHEMHEQVVELQNNVIELKRQVESYREKQTELDIERKVLKDLVESTKKTSESEKRQWEIEKDSLSYQIETLKQSKFTLRKEIEKLKFESSMSSSGFYRKPESRRPPPSTQEKRQPETRQSTSRGRPSTSSTRKSSDHLSVTSRRTSKSKSHERPKKSASKSIERKIEKITVSVRSRKAKALADGGGASKTISPPTSPEFEEESPRRRDIKSKSHSRNRRPRKSSSPADMTPSRRSYASRSDDSSPTRPIRKTSQGSPPKLTGVINYSADTVFMKSREREMEAEEEEMLREEEVDPMQIPPRQRSSTYDKAVSLLNTLEDPLFTQGKKPSSVRSGSSRSASSSAARDRSDPTLPSRSSSRHRDDDSARVRTANTGLLNPFGEPITRDDIKYAFDTFDGKGSGRVTYRQFERIARAFGVTSQDKDLRDIFNIIDANDSSCIEYDEFSISVKTLNPKTKLLYDAIMGRANLDTPPAKGSLSIEQIKKVLDGRKAEWTDRVDAMHILARHFSKSVASAKFYKHMRVVKQGLLEQLKDGRSMVVRETCIVIAKIAKVQKVNFTKYAEQFLTTLMDLVKMPVAVMSNSGKQATLSIVKNVPDNRKLTMLNCILDMGRSSGHKAVRIHAFDLLLIMIMHDSGRSRTWWKTLHQTLKVGMLDSAVEVRTKAYEATALCELQESGSVESLLSNLGTSARRRFDKVLEKKREERKRGF